VRVGQKAIITSAAISGQLQGEVTFIGLEVNQQDVFSSNPQANTDHKVVEVKIRLIPEDSQKVTNLSNLQVEVVIEP
jgi:HlyD family secretion protein